MRPSRLTNCIDDEQIIEFVNSLKEAAFTSLFSKTNHTTALKAFQYLTFLRGDLMLPPLIDKLNESIESLIEPHRYTSILGCLVMVARELAMFNSNLKYQTQLHIIPLMSAVLPGLDPNDSNKSILTLQFLHNVISCVLLCDCTPALDIRNDLSDHERELIFQTTKFEDFVHEFFVKIFTFIDNLSSDAVNESSATAAHASTQYTIGNNKNMDDISQVYLLQVLKVLIRQSSKEILKLILSKVRNYISGNSYNIRSGRILASLCYYLASTVSYYFKILKLYSNNFFKTKGIGESAFSLFFEYVYENLKKFKESKNCN
jgi:proteasome activator subunit 4